MSSKYEHAGPTMSQNAPVFPRDINENVDREIYCPVEKAKLFLEEFKFCWYVVL